jgi:site-specific recombinase XerD
MAHQAGGARPNDLCHPAATFLLAQGMTLEDVKNQLGHSTIVLTSDSYGHVLEQRQRDVARAMDAVLGGCREFGGCRIVTETREFW